MNPRHPLYAESFTLRPTEDSEAECGEVDIVSGQGCWQWLPANWEGRQGDLSWLTMGRPNSLLLAAVRRVQRTGRTLHIRLFFT